MLAHRGRFGDPRPPRFAAVPLPPAAMPSRQRLRPLKAWRYVGVFTPEFMICVAVIRIGPARQSFWAVWDRQRRLLREHTAAGRGGVQLNRGTVVVRGRGAGIDLRLDEQPGVECICPSGASYGWTRKQGGVRAHGRVMLEGRPHELDARAIIDDTAAYYERHTRWRWAAGVGESVDGVEVAWNLVDGVNDPAQNSERTVWVAGAAREAPPSRFASDLNGVDALHFHPEAVRERRENRMLIRSRYRQPFGTFSGSLPGAGALREGYGVMEDHDVWW